MDLSNKNEKSPTDSEKPQHEIVYNRHIPFAETLNCESQNAFKTIKDNLVKSVLKRDLQAGFIFWTSRLSRYIRLYGLKFTKNDHISLVKLYYEVVATPDLEGVCVEKISIVLVKLLKKRELLNRSDVTLDWKPLYKLCERLSYSKMEQMGLEWIPQTIDSKLRSLVRNCRYLFPPESTQEMLDEWKPLLCPYDVVMSKACRYFDWFLPTLVFSDNEANLSWKLWCEEFLTLWQNVRNGPSWEKHFVNIFARLAHNNIGQMDWTPMVNTLFTRILRSFQLPVGKLQHTTALADPLHLDTCCLWLVSMMGGAGTSVVLDQLQSLINATESYFHPSNYGKWFTGLSNFLNQISAKFASRLFRERFKKKLWEPKIPESHLLQDSDIERFVTILKPVTLLSLYGKVGSVPAARVLQILAYLKPEIIVPSLLEKTYVALETLTEPHQARACLSALSSTLHPALHGYPEVRKHIIPLLFQCLPAIDPNDLPKSMFAFQFISTCMSLIPIVDCSEAVQHHQNLSEDDREVCYATQQFEDFVLQFIDRCFVLLENLNQEHGSRTSEHATEGDEVNTQAENIADKLLASSMSIIMQQTSKLIYQQCLNKIFRFATSTLLEGHTAVSAASRMFVACAKAYPKESYAKFIPHYCSTVSRYFEEYPDAMSEEKIDRKLLWDLTILSEVCHAGSEHLLDYKDMLFDVVKQILSMTSVQGYSLGSRLLRYCIQAWANFYNQEVRSVSHSFNQDPSVYIALKDWGATANPWELNVLWHIPSKVELEACFEILHLFLEPQLEKLKEFNGGLTDISKEELLRILHIINDLLFASSLLLPMERSDLIETPNESDMDQDTWAINVMENLDYHNNLIAENNGDQIRKMIFSVVQKTLQIVLQKREDDIKSICMIIKIYSHCALLHEQEKVVFDHKWKVFSTYKMLMSDPLHQNKERNRICLVDRIMLQYSMRVLAVARRYTSMHHEMMFDLITLSMSHYMKVRRNAQSVFFHGMALMPSNAGQLYLPPILKNLDRKTSSSHQQYKGVLYLLLGKPKGRYFLGCAHKWDVMEKVWPALINAPHSDKPSIGKLFDKMAIKVQSSFNTLAIENRFTEQCLNAAASLKSEEISAEDLNKQGLDYLQKSNASNYSSYLNLVSSLTDLYETDSITWKNKQLALGMISLMLRHDVKMPTRMTTLYVKLLIDDALSIRVLAIGCVASLMKQQKRQHVVVQKSLQEITGIQLHDDNKTLVPGDRHDNKWHQYDEDNLPDNEEKYNSSVFIDKTHWGYYCWPKKLKTYDSFEKQPKLDRERSELSEDEKIVFDHFTDPVFVDKLIQFLCIENEKGKDKFDSKKMDLFRGLFRNFGDTFMPLFKVHVERLVNEKQETHHRCAAEIVTGMVMGSKHWSFEKVKNMWDWVIPVLRTAVANISSETMKDWDKAFGHIVQNRDPRRIHWVLKFLVEEPEKPSASALVHSSKLYVLQGGIHQQEWRVPQLLHKMLEQAEPQMCHPYKSLRSRIGSLLASIFLYNINLLGEPQSDVRTPQVDALIGRLIPQLETLLSDDTPPLSSTSSDISSGSCSEDRDQIQPGFEVDELPIEVASSNGENLQSLATLSPSMIEQIQNDLKKLLPPGSPIPELANLDDIQSKRKFLHTLMDLKGKSDDVRVPIDDSMSMAADTDSERSATIRVFKTILKWLVSTQRSMLQPFRPSLLRLLPVICKLYPVEKQAVQTTDEELHRDTRLCLSCLAQSIVPQQDIPALVQAIENISQSTSWHARYSILPYIQVFVYSNLFAVQQNMACIGSLTQVIMHLMRDEQLEVSQMASITLSGMIQCRVIPCDESLLATAFKLCKTKLKRGQQTVGNEKSQLRLLDRHCGVLILSACVLSSPYSVPNWMPDVLMRIGNHLHDPQPIKGTVQRTLSEFKRTHHDNWHEDKLKFSSDELTTLTDLLVSPSYYA